MGNGATFMLNRAVVMIAAIAFLLFISTCAAWAAPRTRPLLTPREEVERLQQLVRQDAWAAGEYEKMRKSAEAGDGYAAGLLYAMEGKTAYAEVAKSWLLKWSGSTGKQFADWIEGFKANGHGPHMYYELDVQPALTYDRIYTFLDEQSRATIRQALENTCEYRMMYVNAYGSSTPNLEFKPHWYVAVTGMALDEKRYTDWGLYFDGGQFGPARGGVLTVLARLLQDGGVWSEANIYPVAHMVLPLTLRLCRYLQYYDGTDLFNDGLARVAYRYGYGDRHVGDVLTGKPVPARASGRLFIDSFIGMTYPLEPTGNGGGQLRVATYGDGATGYPAAWNDLFLCNPAGTAPRILNAVDSLAYAWALSGDLKYAGLLKLAGEYKPSLEWYRPLPADVLLPPAPSTVWPEFGVAMLRADESPSYWTGHGPAVLTLMTSAYGHGHYDNMNITMHAFNRLLYPDYLPQQYQYVSAGYTRQVPAHNTICVDGLNCDAGPCANRHDFTPEVKFHVTSGNCYPGVRLTRALFLTDDYLLDLFAADSNEEHQYDYLIHAIGNAKLDNPSLYQPFDRTLDRYWWLVNVTTRQTDAPWSLDFVQQSCQLPSPVGKFGEEWAKQQVGVRLTMAGSPHTQVFVGDSPSGGPPDDPALNPEGNLPMLVARRNARQAVFAVVHEPFERDAPKTEVKLLASHPDAAFAMISRIKQFLIFEAPSSIDWAFTALGEKLDQPVSLISNDGRQSCSGTMYGWMRLYGDTLTARGNWRGFRIIVPPDVVVKRLTLNGKEQPFRRQGDTVTFGKPPEPSPTLSVSFPDHQHNLIAGMKNTIPVLVRNQTGRMLEATTVVMGLPDDFPQKTASLRIDKLPPEGETKASLELEVPGAASGSLTLRPVAVAGTVSVPISAEEKAWDILPPLAVHPRDALVRLPEKGRTTVPFIAENNTDMPLTATLTFSPLSGVATDPAEIKLAPIPPHQNCTFNVTFISADSGWHTASYTVRFSGRQAPQTGVPFSFPLTAGSVLKADYGFQGFGENLIITPNYTMRTQMLNGASRYLVDGEGRLRYKGDFWNRRNGQVGPGSQFLISGIINLYNREGKLLRGWGEIANVLPYEKPAGERVNAGGVCLQDFYLEDRIVYGFPVLTPDSVLPAEDGMHIETGEDWVQLGGPARWASVLVYDADGKLVQADPPQKNGDIRDNVAGVELFFPGYSTSVAFGFPEPARVQFNGLRLSFDRTLTQTFEMGLIKPGILQTWRTDDHRLIRMFEGR